MTSPHAAPGTAAAIARVHQRATDDTLLLAEIDRLRGRVADLEEAVRILRNQLPLMEYALGPNPAGPDPRWAHIPQQRQPADELQQH